MDDMIQDMSSSVLLSTEFAAENEKVFWLRVNEIRPGTHAFTYDYRNGFLVVCNWE